MTRLDTIEPKLSKMITEAEETLQKKIIINACYFAIKKAELVKNVIITEILEIYANNKKLDKKQRKVIENLIDKYDNEYFTYYEKVENNIMDSNIYLIPFNKARALSAILFCFEEKEIDKAAKEAVYEAATTTDNNTELFDILYKTINNDLTANGEGQHIS